MNCYASYYKCALQMNPSSYASYRGQQIVDDDEYNTAILKKCIDNNISVVGMANHGNVDCSEGLRKLLSQNGIVVFPGFEIMSAEKIHMVCLFPEDSTNSQLNKYIGALGLDTAKKGNETSSLTCIQIANKVKEEGGFWYAAHVTGDNGILKLGKLNTIWQNDLLVAAQIPDSKDNVDPKYKNIINNTDPHYKRARKPAYINACDIVRPEDLDKDNAVTLVKMSEPSFSNFVMAFKDPESRIRLTSEIEKSYQSAIKHLKVTGGYLDGLDMNLSDNLVTIIGGRGTGKSTIINFVRYALDLVPKEKQRKKEFEEMISCNLGTASKIELIVDSNAQYGQSYRIIKRYDADPVIEDMEGKVSNLHVKDIMPNVEIYGQNEIVEAVKNPNQISDIVLRLFKQDRDIAERIEKSYRDLNDNSSRMEQLEIEIETNEEESADLPVLKEKLNYYEKAGLADKIPTIEILASEEALLDNFGKALPNQEGHFERMPEVSSEIIPELAKLAVEYNQRLKKIIDDYDNLIDWLNGEYVQIRKRWEDSKEAKDEEVRRALPEIEDIQDKSSEEIISDYIKLLKRIKKAEPIENSLEKTKREMNQLVQERKTLIEACRKGWDDYTDSMSTQLKNLNNKKLGGVVQLSIRFRQQNNQLKEKLLLIDGIGEKSISGILEYSNFDVFTFAEDVRKGVEHFKNKYKLTQSSAEKIVNSLKERDLRTIEEMVFPDQFDVKLLVNGKYKPMNNLSKGQQCTAILHIILLENNDPLIVDQPEDNLDNSYIAEDLIGAIRDNKIRRQYIFATHNANIPVFGDAEMIIAMEEKEGHGVVADGGIGSVDTESVKSQVIHILEGGEAAFKMREEKYGLVD